MADTNRSQGLFTTTKTYEGGGCVQIMRGIDKTKSDYKTLVTLAALFAREGKTVKILANCHHKSEEYKIVFSPLIGTKYERKCPDLMVDSKYYEYESYVRPWNRRKIKNMLAHGLMQSPYIIIDNNKGAADRIIRKSIIAKLKIGTDIRVVWLYEKGRKRLFFNDGVFIKNYGEK